MKIVGTRHVRLKKNSTLFEKWVIWTSDQPKSDTKEFSYSCDCGSSGKIENHESDEFKCPGCKYVGKLAVAPKKRTRKKKKINKYDKS